jgi:hypothetical protein
MVLLIMTPQQKLSNSTSYNDDGHWYAPFETKRRCRIAMNLSLWLDRFFALYLHGDTLHHQEEICM